MPAWLLPVLLSGLSSAIGNAASAGATSAANRSQAEAFARQRAELAPLLRRLRNPNFGALDRRAITELSRASDQITANRASEGMMNAGRGGVDAVVGQAASDIIAQLAEAKQQADFQNQQLISEILSSAPFTAPDPDSFNPGMDAFLGFLGGAGAGAGQGLATLMGTEFGAEALGLTEGGGGSALTTPPGPTDFGVRYQGLGLNTNFPRTTSRLGGNLQFGPRYAPQIRGFN